MNRPSHRYSGSSAQPFAVLTALATFCLLWIGGLVTSHGAGMAVPDWPTTYGYNMFMFPISKWTGGIFYEHSHRLVASIVGLLTVILAVWLWLTDERRWLRRLGVLAVFLVVGQGVLGGLRVTAMKDELGIFHATLAQLFFILIVAISLFTSAWWRNAHRAPHADAPWLHRWTLCFTVLVLLQLVLGASMRHQHAGLAIPDFPLAYGEIWPATDAASVARYNQARGELHATNFITAGQIHLQMAHRLLAAGLLCLAVVLACRIHKRFAGQTPVRRLAWVLIGLVMIQALLGALTIWSNKAADVATAHVAVGALTLVTSALLVLVGRRSLMRPQAVPAGAPVMSPASGAGEKLDPGAVTV
jgi:cytochrome c oxidase assembly protein subunit 15